MASLRDDRIRSPRLALRGTPLSQKGATHRRKTGEDAGEGAKMQQPSRGGRGGRWFT